MKTTTSIAAALAAAAALAMGTSALAHPGFGTGPGMGWGGPGMGPGWGMGPGMVGGGAGPGWGMGPGMWGGGPGRGMGPGMMGGGPGFGRVPGFGGMDMAAAAAGRLAAMRTHLKITPAQEGAWKAYEGAVTQQASAMQALRDQFHAQWDNAKPGATPPDAAAQHQQMLALRQSGWAAQDKAFKDLWSVLTPEQQALAGPGWGRGGPRR